MRQPENRNGAAKAGVSNKVLPLGMLLASRRRAIAHPVSGCLSSAIPRRQPEKQKPLGIAPNGFLL